MGMSGGIPTRYRYLYRYTDSQIGRYTRTYIPPLVVVLEEGVYLCVSSLKNSFVFMCISARFFFPHSFVASSCSFSLSLSLQMTDIFKDFSLLEHYVLGAVARLHQQNRGPKCFYMIVEQISRLYSNPHMKHQEPSVDVSRNESERSETRRIFVLKGRDRKVSSFLTVFPLQNSMVFLLRCDLLSCSVSLLRYVLVLCNVPILLSSSYVWYLYIQIHRHLSSLRRGDAVARS